jgi:uncharacterized protein GlcG (DUF336 family)
MQRRFWIASTTFVSAVGVATAQQGLPPAKQLTVDAGLTAARAAMKACNDQNYRVSVAVVDADGVLKVQLRGDGVGPHSLDSSRQKAYTAATFKRASSDVEKGFRDRPERDLQRLPSVLLVAGGVPVVAGEEVVGAIGVSGAPGGDRDEACAKAGVDAIKDITSK